MLSLRPLYCCIVSVFLATGLAPAWAAELSTISGHVVDENQQPIPNAQVFMEQGLLAPATRIAADSKGYFEFNDVLPGMVGIIAYMPGRAFNGLSITVGTGAKKEGNTIVLSPSAQVSGRVVSGRDKAVPGAYITHVLLHGSKVAIPYSKLQPFGFTMPTTNAKGQFTVSDLPMGETVAIKVAHQRFAQGVTANVPVGSTDVSIKMTPGVMVSGTIKEVDTLAIVPKAAIIFRNNRPPYSTTITQSGVDGVYLLRLQPGQYTYESIGANHTSVSKPRIIISGQQAAEEINLIVAPKVLLSGKIIDATTDAPIVGAKVRLETQGQLNAFAITGQQGEYSFAAPAGTATIRFVQASGYQSPPTGAFNIPVKAGEVPPMPTFFLLPLPTYSLAVVDAHQKPLPNAIVQVLDPPQLGWRTTDAQGMVNIDLGAMPKGGRVIGYVEHPTQAEGAAFSIGIKEAHDAIVQLAPQHTLSGRIINIKDEGLEGWTVSCQIGQGNAATSVTLWNTVTDADGNFQHPGVMKGAPLVYTASLAHDGRLYTSAPMLYTLNGNEAATLANIMVKEDLSGDTIIGKKFPWRSLKGKDLNTISTWEGERIVVFMPAQSAGVIMESFERQQALIQSTNKRLVLVLDTENSLTSESVALCSGESPTDAKVFIVNADNRVVSESYDLPTHSLIRSTVK